MLSVSGRDALAWVAAIVVGLAAVAASAGSAKLAAGVAAAVAATNALIEVSRAERGLRQPTVAPEWWRRRELSAKARARLWSLLAGGLTLAALARDDGADAVHAAAIAAGVLVVAIGALLLVAARDARLQGERAVGPLPNRSVGAAGALCVVAGLAALAFGSW
jgi:hypothetical protein